MLRLSRVIIVSLCIVLLTGILTGGLLAQTEWTKYAGNPVLNVGPAGSWDGYEVFKPNILFDGNEYKMWYSGQDVSGPIRYRVGYATSIDGIVWQKHAGNPVLDIGASGAWDDRCVSDAMVLFDGTEYKMWYHGYDGSRWRIGYASSPDGIVWQKYSGNPVINLGPNGTWDDFHAFSPNVLFDGTEYKMWYSGDDGSRNRIGYAISPDGIVWSKYSGNPLIDPGPNGTWDDEYAHMPTILYDSAEYEMWYSGHDGSNPRIGYATSADGIVWQKHADNPVLDIGASGTWDDYVVSAPNVLFDGTEYRMWYEGNDGSQYRIGYATSYATNIELDYKLPYPAGERYKVQRGNNTHTGFPKAQYAWDFGGSTGGASIGEPVVAARAGRVHKLKEDSPDDGHEEKDPNTANYVVIDHGGGKYSLYLHLQQNSVPVEENYPVWQGQHIGNIGLSGATSGPHLHFQVQNSGDTWWEQSIPIGFSDPDVARDQGIPQTGEWYTSSNSFIPAQAIDDLVTVVEDMNLQQGLDNSLDAKLEAVSDSLTAANTELRNDSINKLEAFINAVEAQRGNKLTEEQADKLVNYARSIISTLSNGVAAPAFMVDTTIEPPEPILEQNYPNPFNPDTWIPYQLAENADVNTLTLQKTEIYKCKGR